ncbi:MAG: hypothetical protein FWD15_03790 [Alphaproteobacteria bacterium]|nr:hypothetical protein [Alphaproteobacteria bacterium]
MNQIETCSISVGSTSSKTRTDKLNYGGAKVFAELRCPDGADRVCANGCPTITFFNGLRNHAVADAPNHFTMQKGIFANPSQGFATLAGFRDPLVRVCALYREMRGVRAG